MNNSSFDRLIVAERSSLARRAAARLDGNLRRRVSASDIVQQALMKAIRKRDRLQRRSLVGIRCYLVKTVMHELITQWRRHFCRSRTPKLERFLDEARPGNELKLLAGVKSPSDTVASEEEYCRLIHNVHALPDRMHKVIVDRYINGRPYDEIAEEMKISRDAVKRLIERAIQRLRAEMK